MKVEPYLFFNGRCEEAIEFYKETLGAELLMLMRYKDNPDKPPRELVPAAMDDKIMHANLKIGETHVMASDGMQMGAPEFKGMALSVRVPSEADADRVFHAISKGGHIQMPIGKTFFSPRFGMVTDKFGVLWMVIAQPKM